MKQMTPRTAEWMKTVLANCQKNTGRTVAQWTALAKKAGVGDVKAAFAWAKGEGLSTVYQNVVADALFPSVDDDEAILDAQYAGPKAALRPIFDAVTKAARGLGKDVSVMPRKTQVTLSRGTSFAVVRPATRDRVDVALKLHGEKGTSRLVPIARAMTSDPSHVVALKSPRDVDAALVGWLRAAYARAKPGT